MKSNKAVLGLSAITLAVSIVSSVSFGAVKQYGCSQVLPENVQQTVSTNAQESRNPAQDAGASMTVGEKLKQARQTHHVTPQNIDCAFDALAD